MTSRKVAPEVDVPVRQVNNILRNLRGEHFRHARNVQGKPVFSASLSSHAHNQPTLPIDLIYPSGSPVPATTPTQWVPGPSPPKSWRSPTASSPSTPSSGQVKSDISNTPAWRERALSLFFSADVTLTPSERARSRLIYPDPSPIPQLTLLCLQLIRATCPCAELAQVVSYIPLHLRRALLRYTAIHAPLSQIELDTLCEGTTHVDTELVVVGPHNTLRASAFRKNGPTADADEPGRGGDEPNEPSESWDAVQMHWDSHDEPLALRSLAVLSSPLSAAAVLAFPPTITHLALVNIPHRIPLQRLPAICPLLVLLDLSYNTWLCSSEGVSELEEVGWPKFRRLEVLGLRACPVTQKLLLKLNRGRWEDVRVFQ